MTRRISFVDSFSVAVADLPPAIWGRIIAKMVRENESPVSALESCKTGDSERGSEGKLRTKAGSVASPIHLQEKYSTSPARFATEVAR